MESTHRGVAWVFHHTLRGEQSDAVRRLLSKTYLCYISDLVSGVEWSEKTMSFSISFHSLQYCTRGAWARERLMACVVRARGPSWPRPGRDTERARRVLACKSRNDMSQPGSHHQLGRATRLGLGKGVCKRRMACSAEAQWECKISLPTSD